ncbi:MAG: VanW family protein [Crocinitomicaceae bacterium]|nr:VanW family protein [Crocinitomicaceae bacterium]
MVRVDKPKYRSQLRKKAGKEFYCIKQRFQWWTGPEIFARDIDLSPLPNQLIKHQSILLRPLKGVDLYLQHNKIVNLRLAIAKINGIIIEPGQTFSFWKLVGRPTRAKGYLEGMTLSNGNVTKGVGGGLCQLGNLIYWMSLHTPLTVTKRWRHSYDVFPDVNRKLPFGCGATLSYNYIDLQLRNDTNTVFQINLSLTKTHLQGNICSGHPIHVEYKVFERNPKFELQWWGGYTRHNQLWRTIINKTNQKESEELICENHAIMMYNPLLETGQT